MLASARFNQKTFREREEFMRRNNIECIYGTQLKIKPKVALNQLLLVVEMNNEINKIMGIGLIRNILCDQQDIYHDTNYNRFTYMGKYRITREQMEEHDKHIVEIFDLILFKGYTHIKRHSGITIIPPALLSCDRVENIDLTKKVKSMFKTIFQK